MKIMPIAIPDPAARERLEQLQKIAADRGTGPIPPNPHITLAEYDVPDAGRFLKEAEERLRGMERFCVTYHRVAEMKEWHTVICEPLKDAALLNAYRTVASVCPEYLQAYYRTEEIFTPHTTLVGRSADDLTAAVREMNRVFSPFRAVIERIDLSAEIKENEFEIIGSVLLR